MNIDDFQKNLTWIHDQIDGVLAAKGDEYAGEVDKDRLHNFKVAAATQGITTKEALAGMMAKHTVSVYDMIGDGRAHSQEKWDEKIVDHINYLILLRALVLEDEAAKPAVFTGSLGKPGLYRPILDPKDYTKPVMADPPFNGN